MHFLFTLIFIFSSCSFSVTSLNTSKKIESHKIQNQQENDKIFVSNLEPQQKITSPFTIEGKAKGFWFFEASFPVLVLDENGNILLQTYAEAQENWMTESFVPFKSTLEFDTTNSQFGFVVLKKQNASGDPERDESIRIPVKF